MPDAMIQWLNMTAAMIMEGDIFKENKEEEEEEAPYSCPIEECPPCPFTVCPKPEQIINWIDEPEKPPNYIVAKHTIKVQNVTNYDSDSNRAQLEKVYNDGDIMKVNYE